MSDIALSPVEFGDIAGDILQSQYELCFKAGGNSMRPFLLDGDIITVRAVSVQSLRQGDIILYRRATGHVVAHRIVTIATQRDGEVVLGMTGDASSGPLESISVNLVLGRVTHIKRGNRNFRADTLFARSAALVWMNTKPIGRIVLRIASGVRRRLAAR